MAPLHFKSMVVFDIINYNLQKMIPGLSNLLSIKKTYLIAISSHHHKCASTSFSLLHYDIWDPKSCLLKSWVPRLCHLIERTIWTGLNSFLVIFLLVLKLREVSIWVSIKTLRSDNGKKHFPYSKNPPSPDKVSFYQLNSFSSQGILY